MWKKKKQQAETEARMEQEKAGRDRAELRRQLSPISESSKYLLSEKNRLQQEGDDFRSISESFDALKEQELVVKATVNQFRDKFDEVTEVTTHFEEIVKEMRKTATDTKNLVASIKSAMETLENNNKKLLESIGYTKTAMEKSMEYIGHTEEVIGSIANVASRISAKSQDMEDVFGECRTCLSDVDRTIDGSQGYYDNVSQNLGVMARNITKKSLIFEDISNVLEQYPGIIEKVCE